MGVHIRPTRYRNRIVNMKFLVILTICTTIAYGHYTALRYTTGIAAPILSQGLGPYRGYYLESGAGLALPSTISPTQSIFSGIKAISLQPSLPSYPTGPSGYASGHGSYVGPLAGVLPLKIYPNGAVVPVDVNAALPLAGPSVPLDSHPNGALVPVEPAEVIQARGAALAALDAGGDGRTSNAPYFVAGSDGLIAIGNALVPGNSVSDTDDVAAAKDEFFDAFNSEFQ